MAIFLIFLVLLIGFYAYTRFSYYFRHQKRNMDKMNKVLIEIKELLAEEKKE